MNAEELIKENKMLKTLLGLAGLPEKDRAKRLLMYDLYSLNAQIVNFINKSSALKIDLADLKISDQSTNGLFLSPKNIPLIPLFSIKPQLILVSYALSELRKSATGKRFVQRVYQGAY